MNRLKLLFLGSWQAFLNDELVSHSRTKRVEALFAYLAQEHQRAHSRQELDDFFFPDSFDKARMNLRQNVSRLKKQLGRSADDYLQITTDFLQFKPQNDMMIDTVVFKQLASGCIVHQSPQTSCRECMDAVQAAVDLYRGPFLQDLKLDDSQPFENWLTWQRNEWQQNVVDCLRLLIEHYALQGNYGQASRLARRLLTEIPWDESVHRQLMRFLVRKGDRGGALAHFEHCREILKQELNVEPSPETAVLFEHIKQMPAVRPAVLLPQRDGTIIGRFSEIAQILKHLYQPPTRLLTLLGLGGVGKTRLATHITHRLAKEQLGPFMDGIFSINLTEAETGKAWVSAQLGQVIGHRFRHTPSPSEQIIEALANKECLILIDNGEFLSNSGRLLLSQIIQNSKDVQILVTSRHRLNLNAETTLFIEGLPYDTGQESSQSPLPAEALFTRQAHKFNANFRVDENERAAIAKVTQLTAGLPLALELAASWLRVMAVESIAAEIAQAIDILEAATVDTPHRHQSIRAVFNQSFALLDEEHKRLLIHLAIFANQFEWEGAKAVAAASRTALRRLADVSLLQIHQEGRTLLYSVHPLLRQYLREKQDEQTQTILERKHRQYYGALLETLCQKLDNSGMQDALHRLSQNFDDIQLGWQSVVAERDIEEIGRYAETLHDLLTIRNWPLTGRAMLQQAVEHLNGDIQPHKLTEEEARAWSILYSRLGEFHQAIGDLPQAEAVLRKSEALAYHIEDPVQVEFVYKKLGNVAFRQGNLEQARRSLLQSHELAEELDDVFNLAGTEMLLGAVAFENLEFEAAAQYFKQSESRYRALSVQWGLAHSLRWRGVVAFYLDEFEASRAFLAESGRICEQTGDTAALALLQWRKGELASAQQQWPEAIALLEESLRLAKQLNDRIHCARSYLALAFVSLKQEEVIQAKQQLLDASSLIFSFDQPLLLLELGIGTAVWASLIANDKNEESRSILRSILMRLDCTSRLKNLLSDFKSSVNFETKTKEMAPIQEQELQTAVKRLITPKKEPTEG
ncbi:MAG: BTAD domain-containing putative transcriptional regulator [Chloroflexota bacterium]